MNLAKKIIGLLSVVRGYNILVLVVAQYLASIFIFSNKKSAMTVVSDLHLFYIVLSTILVIAGGYIINNFYDAKADQINRPIKSKIDNIIKQEHQLSLYFTLNFLAVFFSYLVSWRAYLFFSLYIFGIWFYSHKLKKYPILGLISVATLTITPFFALFVYYKNFSEVIFIHAFFLFFVILIRELVKDLENMQGAILNNYQTFTVTYGEKKSKQLIVFLSILTLIPITILFSYPAIRYMKYYFYFAGIVLFFVSIYLKKATSKSQYQLLHNILKILLLIGVFSLLFIDKSLILDEIL